MASSYNPDNSTELSDTFSTALLSQRDLSARVPINYVTAPGINLTPACFSDHSYDDTAAQDCLSNLLYIGFQRFVVDLYWDQSRQTWSLCPVELSTEGNSSAPINTGAYTTSLSTSSSSTSPSASLTEAQISGGVVKRIDQGGVIALSIIKTDEDEHHRASVLHARQTSESSFLGSSAPVSITNSGLTNAAQVTGTTSSDHLGSSVSTASQTAASTEPTGSTHQIGPYSCTTSIGISTLTDVLADYFSQTENNVDATFKFLEFNVHAAAPFNDPGAGPSVPDPARLPGYGNYIGSLINASLMSYIYTPYALQAERANLNESWLARSTDDRPLSDYFTTQPLEDGTELYTLNGWPSTNLIMLRRALRIIVGIGSVDEQMQQYNWDADADTIFPPGYIANPVDTTLSSTGAVSNGCFHQPNVTRLSAINSSWAVSSSLPNLTSLDTTSYAALNLSACGISPILNTTLSRTSASTNISIYLEYMRNTIWGWANDEPSDSDMSGATGSMHCAVANLSNGGLWQVTDCTNQHYGVCRQNNSPYTWTVGDSKSRYYQGDQTCNDNSNFSVPHTPLENQYMLDALRTWATQQDSDDADTSIFWLNFNDLDIQNCWVSGVNSTCPYQDQPRNMTRTVVIPTVAGVIVFLCAILTITVKCAANRRNTRRRRKRGEGGWDYEGVPS